MDIKFENVCKSFGGREVLNNFSCTFKENEINLITGKSGIGKTTVLNLTAGLIKPDSGRILKDESLNLRFVFQEDRLMEDSSVRVNINMALKEKKTDEELKGFFKELSLDIEPSRKVKDLSGGMKRRVAVLRAVLCSPDILLLDEAFKGLDEKGGKEVLSFILKNMKGKTVIAATYKESLFENVLYNKIEI